ncbi:sulfurtransferase [Streptomyces sp. NPDC051561]|uniref:sulfurtransferase n=1 Tax=Streptomyces sp. NPDC051561 TaxID=3365658 RepID=UPI0037A44A4A
MTRGTGAAGTGLWVSEESFTQPLVTPEWLAGQLGRAGLVILDASVGKDRLRGPWIPGARIFDIDGEMSAHGDGLPPHTMPEPGQFQASVRNLGIDRDTCVVVYDAAGIYSSARAWWMLRAMGHRRVAVLDGGLPAWLDAGLPAVEAPYVPDDGRPDHPDTDFTARPVEGAFVGSDEVREALEAGGAVDGVGAGAAAGPVVMDARSRGRFAGTEPEPRAGLRGGHMPGSVNLPFGELMGAGGRMRPEEELRAVFGQLAEEQRTLIVSCGSGVTACVLALGAEIAGYREVSVYDGSWSEWGREGAETPVASAP